MRIVQLTPGAGGMYCGNCLRDNALVAALRKMGHPALMVPLYLPLRLDEPDSSASTPLFFSGVNVYLEQVSTRFRSAPEWLHSLLASPALLKWAGRFAARTKPQDVGELTVSMLRGEEGNQAREIEHLVSWLKTQPEADVVCVSNALLLGIVRRLKHELGLSVVSMLQGEDSFVEALPPESRTAVWRSMSERARDVDMFVAPSSYFADRMASRLRLPLDQVRVVPNGISLDGFPAEGPAPAKPTASAPVLGFFTRLCREKGLDTLVEAFIRIRQRGRIPNLKLRVGGGCGPSDEPFVNALQARLRASGLSADAEFCPNLDRAAKIAFLRSLTIFSAPALYGEAFGLYVIEAMAAGVPVVQPRHGAFPELIKATGGGVVYEPADPDFLVESIEGLLLDPARAASLGQAGRTSVRAGFSAEAMARGMLAVFAEAGGRGAKARAGSKPG